MKKVFFSMVMAVVALSFVGCGKQSAQSAPTGEYVDLGLPSGTQWRDMNESNPNNSEFDLFTFDEAYAMFGESLPGREQWAELQHECKWEWKGNGSVATGPNGKSIFFPADGETDCDGRVTLVGDGGYYWSSEHFASQNSWYLATTDGGVYIYHTPRCPSLSVRLVK